MSAHLPYPLVADGQRQAAEAVGTLLDVAKKDKLHIHRVVDASILLRAWQTAGIIARGLSEELSRPFEVEEFAELTERSVGAAANLTIDEIAEVIAEDPRNEPLAEDWRRDSNIRLPFPGAESLVEAGQRVAAHLERRARELQATESHDCLKVIVGHGGSIRHAAMELGLLLPEEVAQLSMQYCTPVFLELHGNGSWQQVGGSWKDRSRQPAMD
jgi:2,3-bisphosphoglycerate-dependent phosphoglycerate mutase